VHREREARRAGDRPTKNRGGGGKKRERAVREKASFLLKSTDGKSTPLLRSPPDRAEPPGRTTPSLAPAPDTANDAIPRAPSSRSESNRPHVRTHAKRVRAWRGVAAAEAEEERRGILLARGGSEQGWGLPDWGLGREGVLE
jgi:hypothetical protein